MDTGMMVIGLCLMIALFWGKPSTMELVRSYLQEKIRTEKATRLRRR